MKREEFVQGIAIGFLAGVSVTGLLVRKFVKEWTEEDKRIAERNAAVFNHLVDTLSPYAPDDVLNENADFIKFQQIIMEERRR